MTTSPTLPAEYRLLLEQAIARPNRNQLHYFTEYREFQTTTEPMQGVTQEGNAEFLKLASGEQVRLDRIISLDGKYFPGYEDYDEAIGARCSV
jgi:Rho-binding antiterminator